MKNFSPNSNFKYYLYWLSERMNIFWNRYNGNEQPWTHDPILQKHKFTNVYRAMDRVSQYLIREVIYDGVYYKKEDIFWRILLFKHFNRIETWEYLEDNLPRIDATVNIETLSELLNDRIESGEKIYSNAYMLTASFLKDEKSRQKYGIGNSDRKHEAYLKLLWRNFFDEGVIFDIFGSESLGEMVYQFQGVPTIAKFLSMQYAIDMNYSTLFNFDENDYIVAGPGAERGIERTFDIVGKPDYVKIIKWVTKNLRQLLDDYGYKFSGLPNREPHLIDIQNCFCETDKYMRGLGIESEGVKRGRIKQVFHEPKQMNELFFPYKWNIKF